MPRPGIVPEDDRVLSVPLTVLPDPDPTDDHALQAWVDGMADGLPVRLLLDTGTPQTALPHVEPWASRPQQTVPGGRGAFGSSAEEALVTVEQLVIGDLVTGPLPVQLQPPHWPHPALLGMDVLGTHRCTFHADDPRIEIDGPPPPGDGWLPFPTSAHGGPAVELSWGRTVSTAVWDTGAGVTVVDRTWAEARPDLVVPDGRTGVGTDVTGARAASAWATLAPFRIGGRGFADQVCAVVDLASLNAGLPSPIQVVLGLTTISRATWWMDFPGRRWTVR